RGGAWRGARRRGRRLARRRRDPGRALLWFSKAVQARLLLVGRARGDRLDVLVIALVLGGEHSVLVAEVAGLLGELVADVGFLGKGVAGPDGDDQEHRGGDDMAHRKTAGADAARCNEDLAVSHAG